MIIHLASAHSLEYSLHHGHRITERVVGLDRL
jgi:hypothetical protein